MCATSTPLWISTLSALLTPTIAILAASIAFLQWKTADKKVKMELFEKRYELFKRLEAQLGETIFWKHDKPALDSIKFLKTVNEVQFIFSKKSADFSKDLLDEYKFFIDAYHKVRESDTDENRTSYKTKREPLISKYSRLELHFYDDLKVIQ